VSIPSSQVEIEFAAPPVPFAELLWRRVGEPLVALLVLLILSPVLCLVATLVALEREGGVFFTQERIGLNGRRFRIFKFRTMVHDAESLGPAISQSYDDPRITPLGRVLRRAKIDELPQLINVVKGEMALVGPRPERPHFHEQFRSIPGWERRISVKPGVTGLAQIDNRVGHDPVLKIAADLNYIRNRSVAYDFKILGMTASFLVKEISLLFGRARGSR
jgi:lipopolysaccharide/colanic/teichoic acid biosynthesis glycosyltransferase